MSAQLIELLFLAGITFFLVSKLFATLGTTDEEDSAAKQNSNLKDVTGTTKSTNFPNYNLATSEESLVKQKIADLKTKLSNFSEEGFINSASKVFFIITEAINKNDYKQLENLVDKRYIDKIKKYYANSFKNINNNSDLKAEIEDIIIFGRNVSIRVSFTNNKLSQEWTFVKNLHNDSKIWLLSNIQE